MTEHQVIEQLSRYRQMQARIQVLSTYSVGSGITVSRLNQDDQLQELHRRLRGLPSYMYISQREQRLESTAHAYLGGKYPVGVKSQYRAIPGAGYDDEDTKLLRELKSKISKVIAARGYEIRDDIDAVLDRLAELQDLQDEVNRIDTVLLALEKYKPHLADLLRKRYVEGYPINNIRVAMSISERTFFRWKEQAEAEFIKLTG